jgi:hypothetical protein
MQNERRLTHRDIGSARLLLLMAVVGVLLLSYTPARYYTSLGFGKRTTSGIAVKAKRKQQVSPDQYTPIVRQPEVVWDCDPIHRHQMRNCRRVPIDKFVSILHPGLLDESPPCPIGERCAIRVQSEYGTPEPVTYWGDPRRRTSQNTVTVGRPAPCKVQLEIPVCDRFFGNCKFQYDQSLELQFSGVYPIGTLIDRHVPPVDPSAPDPPPCQ